MEFLFYIFKASVCISIFYGFYRAMLSRTTFYQWNRFYLIGTTLFSLFVPLITMPLLTLESTISPDNTPVFLQDFQGNITNYQNAAEDVNNSFSAFYILIIAYSLITSYLLLKFFLDIFQVLKVIKKSEKIKE